MFALRLLFCCLALGAWASLQGLDPAKKVTQYSTAWWTTDNGLPQSSVYAIEQAPEGYLWLGTEEGLVRFDGTEFTVVGSRSGKGLRKVLVRALKAGPDGSLWVGTAHGLWRLRSGRRTSDSAEEVLPGVHVVALEVAHDGTVWAGSVTRGLYEIRRGKVRWWTSKDGLPGDEVNALAVDESGALWVATTAGVARLEGRRFELLEDGQGQLAKVAALRASRDGSMWLGTRSGGLVRWKGGVRERWDTRNGLPGESIAAILEDKQGSVWVSCRGKGLARIYRDQVEKYGVEEGLKSDKIVALAEDREGNLWGGTATTGLVVFKDARFYNYGKPEGLQDDIVWAILRASDGAFWLTTDSAGLVRWHQGKGRKFDAAGGLPDREVYGLCETRKGVIWVGLGRGRAAAYSNGRFSTHAIPGLERTFIFSIAEDTEGGMWFAGRRGGVVRVSGGSARLYDVEHGFPSNLIGAMIPARQGGVWVGTQEGVLVRIKGETANSYRMPSRDTAVRISTLYEDTGGALWVGTSEGTILRWKDERLIQIGPEDEDWPPNIWPILDDRRGYFWVGSNRGIFRLSKDELNANADGRKTPVHPVAFGIGDGLRTNEINGGVQPAGCVTTGGTMLFPTVKGVAVIQPKNYQPLKDPPPVRVETVLYEHKPLERGGSMRWMGRSAKIEFAFAAITFRAPERVQFRYRLLGFDPDWVEAGTRRRAYYTNLPPGEYVFEVKASSPDGVWGEKASEYGFKLAAPFYLTWWFYTFCGLWLAALAGGGYLLRVRNLIRRNAELERKVRKRTTELERAMEEAQKASKAKSEFLANMSHEIRTPMNAVVGLTSLLAEMELEKEAHDAVRIIRTSGEALLGIINDILDFSKLESGKVELEKQPVDLRGLIAQSAGLFERPAAEKGVRMVWKVDETVPGLVTGDETRLRQVLLNLISNAVKFTAQGEVRVEVELRRGGNELLILVADTGIGIRADRLDRLFQTFSQVDASTTREYGGTGLGLAISRKLVEIMGGAISVDSEEGKGSRFYFTLPCRAESLGAAEDGTSGLRGDAGEFTPLKILLAEDNLINQKVAVRLLEKLGYEADVVANGLEALHAALTGRYDLVLLDVQMPEMDGHEAAREIVRRMPKENRPRLVAMTAHALAGDRQACLESGMDDYLSKPVDLTALRAVLGRQGRGCAGAGENVSNEWAGSVLR